MKNDADFTELPPDNVKIWYREFIFGYLEADGVFMLRLLSSNSSDFVCTEVNNGCFFFVRVIDDCFRSGYQSIMAIILSKKFPRIETKS